MEGVAMERLLGDDVQRKQQLLNCSYCVDTLYSSYTKPSVVILAAWEEEFRKLFFFMLLDIL